MDLYSLFKFLISISFWCVENIGVGNPDLFEGDMILTAEQRAAAMAGQDVDEPASRGAIRRGLWPGGVLVYEIDSSFREFIEVFELFD